MEIDNKSKNQQNKDELLSRVKALGYDSLEEFIVHNSFLLNAYQKRLAIKLGIIKAHNNIH